MKRRNIGFLGLYVLLGALVFATRWLTLPLELTAVIAVVTAISVPAANRLETIYEEHLERRQRENRIEELATQFVDRAAALGVQTIAEDELAETVADGGEEPTLENVFEQGVATSFSELPQYRREIIHILILCEEVDAATSAYERARLKTHIGSIVSGFDLGIVDERTAEFLAAFERTRDGGLESDEELSSLFGHSPDQPRDVALEFATSYGTTEQLAIVLFNDRERSAELRRTLGRLIARGKLDTETVNRETAERIKDEMEQMGDDATKYLVFSQKMHYEDAVEDAIERFPHLRIGTKYPDNGFPESAEYMRIYMVYPNHDYGSADRFLQEAIYPTIPDDHADDGFIAAMPLELSELSIYPERDDVDDYLDGTHEALLFLRTGANEDLAEIVSDRVVSEIGLSELLSVLPFNVIVPDIDDREKELIIDNYDEIQRHFGVSELFDWADVDPERLGAALCELDGGENEERWMGLAEAVVGKAEKYSTATYGDNDQRPVEMAK